MSFHDDKLLYIGQKAFINKNGEVLVLSDPNLPGFGLDFPGGKVRKGENIHEALKREVKEETSLDIEIGSAFTTWTHEFVPDERGNGSVYLVGFKCKYLSGEVKLSHEHTIYKWVNKESYKELNDGSEYYKALENYFSSNS